MNCQTSKNIPCTESPYLPQQLFGFVPSKEIIPARKKVMCELS